MLNVLLLSQVVVVLWIAGLLLHRFADWKKQNAMIIVIVLISWYFSLLTVFILPLDISSTVYRHCKQISISSSNSTECKVPASFVPEDVLSRLWRIVYWTSQFLTWILLPLMQSYARSGEFTFYEKLKSAVLDNVLYYGSYLLLCVISILYIILRTNHVFDSQGLIAIASSASNTWGLFLLIILLGFALVDVPQKLWTASNPEMSLARAYFHLSKLNSDYYDAEAEFKELVQKMRATESRMDANDPLHEYMRHICDKIPRQYVKGPNRVQDFHDTVDILPCKATLVRYHMQLKKVVHTYKRVEIQCNRMYDRIYDLQRIVANRKGDFQHFKDFLMDGSHEFKERCWIFTYEYMWQAICKPVTYKILSIASVILSIVTIWSEGTFFIKQPVLSVFAIITNATRDSFSYLTLEMMCAIVLIYLCYCAYSTVLSIKLFNYYHFETAHQTDEHSLIFSAMVFSRLTPPLCLNFLGLIHMDSHIIKSRMLETQYTQIMGHMDVIWIISNGFNIYFPMIMLVISFATYFNVGSILLSSLGFPQYLSDDEITEDIVTEGQRLAAAEKDRRFRKGLLNTDVLDQSHSINDGRHHRRFRSEIESRDGGRSGGTSRYDVNPVYEEFYTDSRSSNTLRDIFDDV